MQVIDFFKANCKHCYKCVRSCPVKAIKVKDAQAQIMTENCILCGRCLEVCPQNAKRFDSDLERVKDYIRNQEKVIVSIAPSYLGILNDKNPGQVVWALKKLGFFAVRETAEGAAYVTAAFEELMSQHKMKNIISTCCPSVNDFIEKYYPELIPYMAPVVSPMIAHGMLLKKMYGPETKVVFLGPCIAKKEEAEGDQRTGGAIDAVINFTEFEQWLIDENIHPSETDTAAMDNPDPQINRLYPVSGGVITSVMTKHASKKNDEKCNQDRAYRRIFIDGVDNCREFFDHMESDGLENCFIEANMCEGGCIKGPAVDKMNISRYRAAFAIEDSVAYKDDGYERLPEDIDLEKVFYSRCAVSKMPTEAQIQTILKATGKYNKDQELNCGACGYPTCREKAIAVYQGKAEQEMCLPYTYEKARSMSNVVMETTPNGILIVESDYRIVEFSRQAEKFFNVSKTEALQMYIFELMPQDDFDMVMKTHKSIYRKKVEMVAYGITVLETLVHIPEIDGILCILQDITDDEKLLEEEYNVKLETVEMAQKVIDKQMMVAQEIAGLLGETTAETKAILNKMKRSILK